MGLLFGKKTGVEKYLKRRGRWGGILLRRAWVFSEQRACMQALQEGRNGSLAVSDSRLTSNEKV